jgi:ribosomal protein L11 methylase PrmA
MVGMVIELVVDADAVEAAIDRLFLLGATAVAEEPGPDGADAVRLTTELPDGTDLAELGDLASQARPAPAQDHAAAPVVRTRVGRVVVHHPDDTPAPGESGGAVTVAIEAGDAFGHGAHPSTRLALGAVVARAGPGIRVLDVGCGSGVLAVAAAALGATAVAVDIDPAAVAATVANARRNGVGDRVHATTAPVSEVGGPVDLVVANLLLADQRPVVDVLARLVEPGGSLAVSGLLAAQLDELLALLPPWPARRERDGDWAAATLLRPVGGSRTDGVPRRDAA